MLMKHKFKFWKNILLNSKVILLLLLILVPIITLPILQSTNARAEAQTDAEIFLGDIKSYSYYNALAYCMKQSNLHDDDGRGVSVYNAIKESSAISGDWFSPKGGITNLSSEQMTAIGVYNISSGEVGCYSASFIKTALESLGNLDPIVVLCNSGFRRIDDQSNSVTACIGGSGDFQRINGGNGSPYDTGDSFKAYIKEPTLTGAQWYRFYRDSLAKSCIPGINNGPIEGASYDPADQYNYTQIRWVARDGTIETGAFAGTMKKTAKVIFFPGGDRGSNTYETTCSDIVAGMDQYVDKYAEWALANPEIATAVEESTKSDDTKTTCAIESIGWIICPVTNFLAKIADGAFKFLASNFLETKPGVVDNTSATFTAWSTMRNIANVVFVIAFLVIIFSQLTSAGITNYGIKKLLPRLIIAAILVNLSYYICQIAVDLSNILGWSLKDFLEGIERTATGVVVQTSELTDLSATGNRFTDLTLGILAGTTAVVGVVAIAWTSLATLIPVLLAAVVALVMILFILVARQALIILLVVLSPLAFVAFLLPNTEDWFKKWQKAFTAMLMLFPIVALVFGISSLASGILQNTFAGTADAGTDRLGEIVAVAVMALPLFVVPGLLKKALDGVGDIGGKITALGDKWGGSIGKKGVEGFGKTRLGQYQTYTAGERAKRAAQIQSGSYRGRGGKWNPNNWASRINQRVNEGKFSGEFGNQLSARGNALADEQDAIVMKNSKSRVDNLEFSGVPISQSQMMQLALNKDITHDGTDTGTVVAKKESFDVNARRNALLNTSKIATVKEAHALVDASSVMTVSERKSLVTGLSASSVLVKAPHLGGSTLGKILAGTASSDNAALGALESGKITAEALSLADPDSITKYVSVARTTPLGSQERHNLEEAYNTFSSPASARLREKVVKGSNLDQAIQEIALL